MPNLRYTARGRPHNLQRLSSRLENLGFRSALAIFDLLAMNEFAFAYAIFSQQDELWMKTDRT